MRTKSLAAIVCIPSPPITICQSSITSFSCPPSPASHDDLGGAKRGHPNCANLFCRVVSPPACSLPQYVTDMDRFRFNLSGSSRTRRVVTGEGDRAVALDSTFPDLTPRERLLHVQTNASICANRAARKLCKPPYPRPVPKAFSGAREPHQVPKPKPVEPLRLLHERQRCV